MALDALPESKDAYWEEAKVEVQEEPTEDDGCDHFFYHRSGLEVECKKCHIGFWLDNYSEVVEGHIYNDGEFVI